MWIESSKQGAGITESLAMYQALRARSFSHHSSFGFRVPFEMQAIVSVPSVTVSSVTVSSAEQGQPEYLGLGIRRPGRGDGLGSVACCVNFLRCCFCHRFALGLRMSFVRSAAGKPVVAPNCRSSSGRARSGAQLASSGEASGGTGTFGCDRVLLFCLFLFQLAESQTARIDAFLLGLATVEEHKEGKKDG